jgi:hypothetical protein
MRRATGATVLFFNEWRAAARAASAAERAVSQAYLLYMSGKGEMPSAQLIADSKRKRDVADDLFKVALGRWREAGRGPLRD